MKLLRYGRPGKEKPGLLDQAGRIRDLSGRIEDITPATLAPASLARLARIKPESLPAVRGRPRLGVPVGGIGKMICVGLNYTDHAKELGWPLPPEPPLFSKAISAIVGPDDDVQLPRGSKKSDWEVELGIIIGRTARYVSRRDALDHVAGYCVCNDVSERAYQLERGGQWIKGKSADTFGPIGPWLVTRDEVPNPQALRLWLEVNGERMQDSSTAKMIAGVATLISYISGFLTLHPGDVIATGTPSGVGTGRKPQRFLKPGDVMRLGVEGLGEQCQRVVRYKR
mgnify:CR=1 FL=1